MQKTIMLKSLFLALTIVFVTFSVTFAEGFAPYRITSSRGIQRMANEYFAVSSWNMQCNRVLSGRYAGQADCSLEPWDGRVFENTGIRGSADATIKVVIDETQNISIFLNNGGVQYGRPFSFSCGDFQLTRTVKNSYNFEPVLTGDDADAALARMTDNEECIVHFTLERSTRVVTLRVPMAGLKLAIDFARGWVQ